jgi:maleylpyruvate isomerase
VSEPPPWDTLLGWVADGQQHVERAAASLDPVRLRGPSRLAGWSRGHVLSHLARNADALTNLLTWARTGIESPMYSSSGEREDGISAGAHRELAEQLADLAAAGSRFQRAAEGVTEVRRSCLVRSAQGREIAAREVPWLRVREVWLHLVDLDTGYDIDVVPDDIAWSLTKDVAAWMTSRTAATVDLLVDARGAIRLGPGAAGTSVIRGNAARVAGWLTGRTGTAGLAATAGFPDLPRWL